MPVKPFQIKVAGVTLDNPDGESRQDIITGVLYVGDEVYFVRDPGNEMDLFAVKITTSLGRQIGWVPHTHSYRVGSHMDEGGQVHGVVSTILHGDDITGVRVLVSLKEKEEPETRYSGPMGSGCLVAGLTISVFVVLLIAILNGLN